MLGEGGAGGCGVMCGVMCGKVVRLTPDLRSDGGRDGAERWTRRGVGGGGGVDMQALAAAVINQTGCDAS